MLSDRSVSAVLLLFFEVSFFFSSACVYLLYFALTLQENGIIWNQLIN